MESVPITGDQLAQLQAKVAQLVADKAFADQATAASKAAHAALAAAQTDVAAKDTAEGAADSQVNGDLADLRTFIDSLSPVAPVPAP